MTLKISFESDIKGFERVQRALESQQKVLNQNADAVERLQKAQSGFANEAMGMKGMEDLTKTDGQIKNLVDSLDHLTSKRNSLKSFFGLFGEFGDEMKKLNSEASMKIFDTMGNQIDGLKNNMRGTSELMKQLRLEIDEANAAGKGDEAAKKSVQLNELATKQMTEGDMLAKLQQSYMWRRPIGQMTGGGGQPPGGDGTMAGFIGGGTSMQRLAGIMGGLLVATKGLEAFAKQGSRFTERGERGAERVFERDIAIARAATEGGVGRQIMLEQGTSEEARFIESGGNNRLFRKFTMGFKQLFNPTMSQDEIIAEELEDIRKLDERKRFGLNAAGSLERRLAANADVNQASLQYGDMTVRNFIQQQNREGVTTNETVETIKQLAALGIIGDIVNQATPTEGVNQRFGDLGFLSRDPAELMMTKQGAEEMRRRVALGTQRGEAPDVALNRYMRDLGGVRAAMGGEDVPIEVMTQISDYVQGIQAGIVGAGAGEGVTAGTLTQTMRMAAGAVGADRALTPSERAQTSIAVQQDLGAEAGKAGSALSMGIEYALIRLGVNNSVDRAAVASLIEGGQQERAVQLVVNLTGKDEMEIKRALNIAVEDTRRLQDLVAGETDSSRAAYESAGLGGRAAFLATGDTQGIRSTAAFGRARRTGLFDEDSAEPTEDPLAPIRRETGGREIRRGIAQQDSELLDANRKITEAVGQDIRNALATYIAAGFRDMADKMAESINQGAPQVTPTGRPVEGGQQEKVDALNDRLRGL